MHAHRRVEEGVGGQGEREGRIWVGGRPGAGGGSWGSEEGGQGEASGTRGRVVWVREVSGGRGGGVRGTDGGMLGAGGWV